MHKMLLIKLNNLAKNPKNAKIETNKPKIKDGIKVSTLKTVLKSEPAPANIIEIIKKSN
jgi:hypothetical protein